MELDSQNLMIKQAEENWNRFSVSGDIFRKGDYELYRSIIHNLIIKKVFLDSSLSLVKFSLLVGTNTTYLSNAINKYFGCNLKCLINKYRVEYAQTLIKEGKCSINQLPEKCGFTSRSVFYVAFKRETGQTPTKYLLEFN